MKGLTDADYDRLMEQIDRAGKPPATYPLSIRLSRFERRAAIAAIRSIASIHRLTFTITEDRHWWWSAYRITLAGHPQDIGRALAGISYHLPNLVTE